MICKEYFVAEHHLNNKKKLLENLNKRFKITPFSKQQKIIIFILTTNDMTR